MGSALIKLKDSGFKCNIEKSLFRKIKIGYVGSWVTHDGVKPID